jgi:hypothetical protein
MGGNQWFFRFEMTKSVVSYHANVDYEATLTRLKEYRHAKIGYSFEVTGGRGRAGAQIALGFRAWNVSVNIFPSGLIQIYYEALVNLRNTVEFLQQRCVPIDKEIVLVALDPDDPIDRSVQLKTINHFQNTDLKYATARILFFWWRDPNSDVFIVRIPDRNNRLIIPGKPFVFDACVPTTVHVMDKYDEQGNRIVTAEKLRRKAIEEAKRIAREHSKVRFKHGRAFDVP